MEMSHIRSCIRRYADHYRQIYFVKGYKKKCNMISTTEHTCLKLLNVRKEERGASYTHQVGKSSWCNQLTPYQTSTYHKAISATGMYQIRFMSQLRLYWNQLEGCSKWRTISILSTILGALQPRQSNKQHQDIGHTTILWPCRCNYSHASVG